MNWLIFQCPVWRPTLLCQGENYSCELRDSSAELSPDDLLFVSWEVKGEVLPSPGTCQGSGGAKAGEVWPEQRLSDPWSYCCALCREFGVRPCEQRPCRDRPGEQTQGHEESQWSLKEGLEQIHWASGAGSLAALEQLHPRWDSLWGEEHIHTQKAFKVHFVELVRFENGPMCRTGNHCVPHLQPAVVPSSSILGKVQEITKCIVIYRGKFSWLPVIRVDLKGGFCCMEISFLFILQFGIVHGDSPLCHALLEEMSLEFSEGVGKWWWHHDLV